jgi:hypothetical protein
VAHTALKFGLEQADVARELNERGMPILAEDCDVVIFNPQRWL